MSRTNAISFVGIALSLFAAPVAAQTGDATRGLAIARTSCSSCHAIAKGVMDSPVARAPSFAKLANMPGMTRTALDVGLHTTHPKMPNFVVTDAEIDDLSAYLASIKD